MILAHAGLARNTNIATVPYKRGVLSPMIKYQLICHQNHEFEGWFSSSASFADQQASGYVDCPFCGSTDVRRALMAPNLNSPKTRKQPDLPALPEAQDLPKEIVANDTPASEGAVPPLAKLSAADQQAVVGAAMTALRDMHKKVKKDFTDVGTRFADEARAMHHGEKDQKPIYGTTTQDEREELADEGVIYHHLPDLPPEH